MFFSLATLLFVTGPRSSILERLLQIRRPDGWRASRSYRAFRILCSIQIHPAGLVFLFHRRTTRVCVGSSSCRMDRFLIDRSGLGRVGVPLTVLISKMDAGDF